LALAEMAKFGVSSPNTLSQTLLANLWPGFALTGPAAANNFFSPDPAKGYSNNGVVKVDHNFSVKERLSFHWFAGQGNQILPPGASPALATSSSLLPPYYEVAPIHIQNYSLVLNSAPTPKLSNQVLFGVNYFNQIFHDQNNSVDVGTLGLSLNPQATFLGAPAIRIAGFDPVGITPPEGRNDITGHLTDIASYNVGRHQFRFGGEVRQSRVDEFYFFQSLGKFVFDGTTGPWAGDTTVNSNVLALADFLAGDVHSAALAVGNAERQVRVNAFDMFLQDSWQITRKLNLNLGLRYEYFGPLHDDKHDLPNFIPSQGLVVLGNGLDSLFRPDWNNIAPRFGFSYQPRENGSLVVRGGFGVFYDQINLNPFLDYRPPNGGADGFGQNPAGSAPVNIFNISTPFMWQANTTIFPQPITTCPTGSGCGTSIFNVAAVDRNFRTPYYYNYNLNIEQGFGNVAVLQIGYVGSEGRKLSVMQDINQPSLADPSNPATPPLQQRRPFFAQFPNFGSINQIRSAGTSNYNSLQTTLRLRSLHGLSSQFSYTWSHALDEVSQYRGVMPEDSFNLRRDYGNSDNDQRNTFAGFLSYEIPGSSHGPAWLTHGWQVSSLLTFRSGQPVNVKTAADTTGTNEGQQRPDLVPGVNLYLSHSFSKSGVPWINPTAFALPTPGTFGDLRRNLVYGPGYGSVDLSVFKNIPIYERFKVQLRAEMFNIFNRKNFTSPSTTFPSSGFGVTADTLGDSVGAPGIGPGEPFNMQLAIKVIF
jgi:TonB dependent receptor